jgi:thiamine pyrophosphokinase
MSSHHIVRDKQEPALIIANGEACSFDLLSQLLEWSPIVMVLDGAITRVLELGIKVDVVLGDFDSAKNIEELLIDQHPIKIVHAPDQNKTDLEKGIEYLIDEGHKAINILWATGRRADHTITNITNMVRYKSDISLVLYDDYSKIFCLPKHFEKWYVKGFPISLIPIGVVSGINSKGLKYNLTNDTLTIGYRTGSSNEAENDGIVTISYEEGDLLMMECRD